MKNPALIPFLLWGVVTLAYAFRKSLQMAGFPIDPYAFFLFGLPLLLLFLKRISPSDMGFRIGKPLYGLFFILLLPGILFLRFYFMGRPFILTEIPTMLIMLSIGEEFFFRGYLQSQFEKSFQSTGVSFFITNFLFMLIHFVKGYSIVGSLMTGIIGLYFSFAKDKSGGDSLIYSSVAHPLYNIVATSMQKASLWL